ncbi:MAG: hypothetical protein WCA12_11705 [Burkholderiales bacterium]
MSGTANAAALTRVTAAGKQEPSRKGAERGRVFGSAQMLARDFANTPHSPLQRLALRDIAVTLAWTHRTAHPLNN